VGPVILDVACTNCGRCIDICSKDVFGFGMRFGNTALLADGEDSTARRRGTGSAPNFHASINPER